MQEKVVRSIGKKDTATKLVELVADDVSKKKVSITVKIDLRGSEYFPVGEEAASKYAIEIENKMHTFLRKLGFDAGEIKIIQ
jgi:hypothetical protein